MRVREGNYAQQVVTASYVNITTSPGVTGDMLISYVFAKWPRCEPAWPGGKAGTRLVSRRT